MVAQRAMSTELLQFAGNDARLSHTMLLLPDRASEEKVGVLYSVCYGGAEVSIGRTFSTSFDIVY